MTMLSIVSRPFFWLMLYFVTLLGVGTIYVNSLASHSPLLLAGATSSGLVDGKLSVSLQGRGLDGLSAYLSLDASNRRAVVGNLPLADRALDIEIVNGQAYVVTPKDGVSVFSLDDPVNPILDDKLPAYGGWHSDYDEKNFYLSSYAYGLLIFPLSGEGSPHRIAGTAISSTHRENRIFVANGNEGLSVYEFNRDQENNNHATSRLLGRLPLAGFTIDLSFLGNHLLAASMAGGLHLVDVSDFEKPKLLQTISGQKTYERVWVVGDIVYASYLDRQLDLFRLSQGRLSAVRSFPLRGKVRDFILDGEHLYLAEESFGVSSLDISDPEHPKRIGMVGAPGEPAGLALFGDLLYVASVSQGVQIVDTKQFRPLNELTSLDTPGNALGLALDGQWLYVADGDEGLQIVDRSDRNNLKIVAQLSTEYRVRFLVKGGWVLFMATDRHGLICVDVSDPLRPKQLGQFEPGLSFSDLAIRGAVLIATTSDGRLLKIDVSDPADLKIVDSIDLPGKPGQIALAGDDVYVATGKAGLQIARFSQDQPGRLIGSLSSPWPMSEFSEAFGVQVRDGYVYLTQGEDGVQIIDIRQPEHPRNVGFIPLPTRGLSLGQSEDFIVVATRWDGYFFIDVSHPQNPRLAANLYLPRRSRKFEIEGDRLYVAGLSRGINVVPLPIKNSGSFKQVKTFTPPELPGWYDVSVSSGKKFVTAASAVRVD